MSMKPTLCAFAISCLVVSLPATASTDQKDIYISDNQFDKISVEWIQPKSFRDVKDSYFSSEKYRKHVFNQLEEHLNTLSNELPKGQVIHFKITDLDMAGQIEPASMLGLSNSMDGIRVMRDIDIPRIKFEYELVDANGVILKTDIVTLKNMGYLNDISSIRRNKPYEHEKRMLTKWFSKNIISEQA